MAGRAIGVYAPGVGGYAFDRGVGGLWRGGRGRCCRGGRKAPQLRGLAAERPRRFRVHGLRDCVQGMPFRVLRGPAAARPRRFRGDRGLLPRDKYLRTRLGVCWPRIGPYG